MVNGRCDDCKRARMISRISAAYAAHRQGRTDKRNGGTMMRTDKLPWGICLGSPRFTNHARLPCASPPPSPSDM